MKIDKKMKRWVFILIAALAIFLTADLCARERGVKFSGGTDLVSTYVWRGVRESGPAFQPSLTMSAGNFSATAWGSVDFDSAYKEMDLTLAYALGPVTLSVADLYWTGQRATTAISSSTAVRPTASRWAPAGSFRKRSPSRCRGTRFSSARPT